MRILICHGYLLKGTGSNQYVQSLARALCRQGHHLIVMCQDPDPRLDFVNAFITEDAGGAVPVTDVVWRQKTEYPGTCMVYKPDIGGLLPVYVLDSYSGFQVKEFTELTHEELNFYVERNVGAVARVIDQFEPEAIQVNHAVMLPFIVLPVADARGVPYFVSIHGSAIDFAVRKDERYREYGAGGLGGAAKIFAPSEHSADAVREVFGGLVDVEGKLVVIPPGVDTELFDLADSDMVTAVERLQSMVESRMEVVSIGDFGSHLALVDDNEDSEEAFARKAEAINARHPDWLPDAEGIEELREMAEGGRPFLMFLGKLLETKGIQNVIPALPLILREFPFATLVIVGFGELRGLLEILLEALDSGDVRELERVCEYGDRVCDLVDGAFAPVTGMVGHLEEAGNLDEYIAMCLAADLKNSVIFTGYLTPEEHRNILPHASAVLVPSMASEAFGLVATEAMASGVVPIACSHSGLKTALSTLAGSWGEDAKEFAITPDEWMVFQVAYAANLVLSIPPDELREKGLRMRESVRERFSWDAVASRMLEFFEAAKDG